MDKKIVLFLLFQGWMSVCMPMHYVMNYGLDSPHAGMQGHIWQLYDRREYHCCVASEKDERTFWTDILMHAQAQLLIFLYYDLQLSLVDEDRGAWWDISFDFYHELYYLKPSSRRLVDLLNTIVRILQIQEMINLNVRNTALQALIDVAIMLSWYLPESVMMSFDPHVYRYVEHLCLMNKNIFSNCSMPITGHFFCRLVMLNGNCLQHFISTVRMCRRAGPKVEAALSKYLDCCPFLHREKIMQGAYDLFIELSTQFYEGMSLQRYYHLYNAMKCYHLFDDDRWTPDTRILTAGQPVTH